LKIIIENTKPQEEIKPSIALTEIASNAKYGKDNPKIVKCLFKVVIDDIEYEISCKQGYLDYLKENLDRFNEIIQYRIAMENAKKEKDKNYYLAGIKLLLQPGETLKNYMQVYEEIKTSYDLRKTELDNLYKEVKIIKTLKV
jgi:hypothetical protein